MQSPSSRPWTSGNHPFIQLPFRSFKINIFSRGKMAKLLELFLFLLFVAPSSTALVAFLTAASQKFNCLNTSKIILDWNRGLSNNVFLRNILEFYYVTQQHFISLWIWHTVKPKLILQNNRNPGNKGDICILTLKLKAKGAPGWPSH